MWRVLPLMFVLACGQKNPTPPADEPPKDVAADAGATADAAGAEGGDAAAQADGTNPEDGTTTEPPPKPTPESLYAECKERVEGVQAEGECTTDADCKPAGCGSEVCTTVAAAAEVMTTCEGRLCFKVLDTCGCHEGQCTWTLKAEVPDVGTLPPKPLPPTRLPPTPAPPADPE